jgi:hypothetical protein
MELTYVDIYTENGTNGKRKRKLYICIYAAIRSVFHIYKNGKWNKRVQYIHAKQNERKTATSVYLQQTETENGSLFSLNDVSVQQTCPSSLVYKRDRKMHLLHLLKATCDVLTDLFTRFKNYCRSAGIILNYGNRTNFTTDLGLEELLDYTIAL